MVLIDPTVPLTLAETMGTVFAAVIDAQQQSARATVDFINEVAFGPNGPDADRKLVTVTFTAKKLDENRNEVPFVLEVPLLALVEIPLVVVSKATVAFSYDVVQTTEPQGTETPAESATPSLFNTAKSALLKGRFVKRSTAGSSTSDPTVQREERASLDVTVELERAEAPVGIERLLDTLELAMAAKKLPPSP